MLKVEELSRRKLSEDQNTIMELRAKIPELQSDVNCMNDSRDFKDAESVRSRPSHVPCQPALFPPYRDPGGLLSRSNQPPDIWNSQGISGNVCANPRASSSSPYPGGFNPWISNVTEDTPVLTSTGQPVTCGERQIPDTVLTPRFQPGPSAGNSFDPKEEIFLQKMSRTTNTALGSSVWPQRAHQIIVWFLTHGADDVSQVAWLHECRPLAKRCREEISAVRCGPSAVFSAAQVRRGTLFSTRWLCFRAVGNYFLFGRVR